MKISNFLILLVCFFALFLVDAASAQPKWKTIFICKIANPGVGTPLEWQETIQTKRVNGRQKYRHIPQITCLDLDDENNCITEPPQDPEPVVGSISSKRAIFLRKDFDLRITISGKAPFSGKDNSEGINANATCERS